MTFVLIGAAILGVISGFLARSIFVGIALPILLIAFFIMWKYLRNNDNKSKAIEDEVSTPPVSVNNIPQQNSQEPTYSQPPQEKV